MSDDAVTEPERREGWRHVPHPSRLARASRIAEIIERHDAALERNMPTYIDPASGFSVFTADFLERRKYCCDSGCRHCPYAL